MPWLCAPAWTKIAPVAGDAIEDDVARELFAVGPEEFMAKRAELAARLKQNGDPAAAAAISKLRKPTVAAWIVNAYVLEHRDQLDAIADIGDRLRAAQHKLEASQLRTLSQERRSLVAALTKQAFAQAERPTSSATVMDEVRGTFDAAVADPDIAARLGRLQRPEQFSGFGFSTDGPPQLTLVRGGKDRPTTDGKKAAEPVPRKPKRTAAEERARRRTVERARTDFEQAETAADDAQQGETIAATRVKEAEKALAQAKGALEDARRELEDARQQVREAKARRRETRQALDVAERNAEADD